MKYKNPSNLSPKIQTLYPILLLIKNITAPPQHTIGKGELSIPFMGFLVLKRSGKGREHANEMELSIPFMGFLVLKPISIFSCFRLSSPTYSPLKRPLRLSPFCKGIYKYNRKLGIKG